MAKILFFFTNYENMNIILCVPRVMGVKNLPFFLLERTDVTY
jgi:hypothetical protein